ncbi:MAG: co-chaperone GroES [Cycloclasticus sp.]|nr:co-chaperone GroES [Cycloclasticus sp. 46_83_sub15_T18]OUR83078.1 co-chaperone GroES [Cycloclasticus sp. 46_120_T64]
MNLRPLGDRVIIQRVEEEAMSAGGIVLPDSAKEKPSRGEVIAVGNGAVNDKGDLRPMSVKVGDKVLFGKYAGTEVEVEGGELLVMSESDVIAVVE